MRTSGFGPSARQAAPTEGLHAHLSANLIAIDVQIAHLRLRLDLRQGLLITTVYAKGQALTTGIDGRQYSLQVLAGVAHQMQYRAEMLLLQLCNAIDFKQHRRQEVATQFDR